MEKMKYIKFGIYKSIIIFPCVIEHSNFRIFNPVSAGFCYIEQDKVKCFGESTSLDLKSNEIEDTLVATKQYIGIDAMLNLV